VTQFCIFALILGYSALAEGFCLWAEPVIILGD